MNVKTTLSVPLDTSLPLKGNVLVHTASQYGVTVMIPANKLAVALCELAGTKNMTAKIIDSAKRMGFVVSTVGVDPEVL